ncbi:isopeptide-forming domain-containing fimbrial protein [Bifidobacterium gallicum]|nr:isopeptide-forming domain-containing fimbrial protein [Bifidobacterium gallicum]KFI59329.1 putative LPXTG-motif protein cell wall anchor domain protein [Bifidobacterium gallicum DSM 20093 = LMG 11596]
MKKLNKAIVAFGVSAAMLATGFAGISTAYAATGEDATVTISNFVAGDELVGYRILDITSENSGATRDDDKFVYAVNAENRSALIAGLKKLVSVPDDATDADLIKLVLNNLTTSANVETFAKAFKAASPTAGPTITDETTSVNQGYYLFEQTELGKDDTYTKSKYLVVNVGKNGATVTLKNGTVSLEKKVADNGDPNAPEGQGENEMNDSADYAIGDTVPFQLTGTLPAEYDEYETFYYSFNDTMSAGLTFKADSVAVKSGATDLTECFTVTAATPITIATANLKACTAAASLTADSEIVVTYNAELNDNAVIGTAGNPNTANLTFSNNPYAQGTGDRGTTPDDKVVVFTWEFDGTKTFSIDPNDADLPVFQLTNNSTGAQYTLSVTKQPSGAYKFGVKGIDAGNYTLTETYTPAGFNKADDITFDIKPTHDVLADEPTAALVVTGDGVTQGTNGALATVLNEGGNKLPETGGMGTVALYTAGAAIVLFAGLGLTLAMKRRNA